MVSRLLPDDRHHAVIRLSKYFGGVHAVDQVSFAIDGGEVVAIVGDNGAGKSTLAKTIVGYHRPDAGVMRWHGAPVKFATPRDARNAGIEMIYQDLSLADNLGAAANVFLGPEIVRPTWMGLIARLDDSLMMKRVERAFSDQLAVRVPSVRDPVRILSGGQRQAVAIARALYWQAKLLIMDEPTAALGVRETRHVLELVHRLKSAGVAIILISHSLRDVMAMSDRIMVMRRGRKVGEETTTHTNEDRIVRLIMGAVEAGEVTD
jgi:ABC-type sugar transport system ATPase subunit